MRDKELIELIKGNVIQGRREKDDEGFDEGMVGDPGVKELVSEAIDSDISPETIIEGLTDGMEVVGEKFEKKEYFIPDLLASAEAVGEAMDILAPHLVKSEARFKGKVIMATVKGDLHDVGKNIVSLLLKGEGYLVKDLGVDVAPGRIVEAIREENPNFVGLSALLTSTMIGMKDIIQKITESGLRDKVKILIGGAPTSEEFAQEIGADAYGRDGFHAVRIVKELKVIQK